MPNYVTNKLSVTNVNERRMQQIKDFVSGEEIVDGQTVPVAFDFNKIIPMPEDLRVIAGSVTDQTMNLYCRYCIPGSKWNARLGIDEQTFNDILMSEEDGRRQLGALPFHFDVETRPQDWDYLKRRETIYWEADTDQGKIPEPLPVLVCGYRYFQNKIRYGFPTWYEWRRFFWETKWNASSPSVADDGFGWTFTTAWTAPLHVIEVLSRIFPDAEFEMKYADEDIGSNCGMVSYKNGESFNERVFDGGKEADEFAIRVIYDSTPEEAGYVFDEEADCYVWHDELEELEES